MPLIITSLLFGLLWGQDKNTPPPSPPTVAELQAKLDKAEKELAELRKTSTDQSKLLQAYYEKFQSCDAELTQLKVLGSKEQGK